MKEFPTKQMMSELESLSAYRENRIAYVNRKKQEGYSIFYPEENELLLDIDSENDLQRCKLSISRMEDELQEDLPFTVFESKTPGHYHVSIKFPRKIDMLERIALQAVLGSDRVREMLSLFRLWQGEAHPSLLARKN